MNNLCKEYSATSIQQLTKLITDKNSGKLKEKNVYPISLIQSIFDGITGNRLDVILSLFNCLYVPYAGSKESTRLNVSEQMRRTSLILTFKDSSNNIYTQRYIGTVYDDSNWSNDNNWENCFVSFESSKAIEQLKQYFIDYINDILGDTKGIDFIVVTSLPSVGEKGYIYFVKNNSSTETNNIYDEYIWLENKNSYEKLGSFNTNIDLSNYQTKLVSGENIKTINGESILGSGNINITGGAGFPSDGTVGQYLKKSSDGVVWATIPFNNRIILNEFANKKFFGEFAKVTGASSIGWAGALLIDDFSSNEYRDFYCCMTYGQGIVIRHTYATDTYEYLNSFIVDSSTTSSSYSMTNKLNSGGWGKIYEGSPLPLAYISRCSPDSSYIHTYYAYQINTSVTPYTFTKKLTIKYGGSKLAAITSDITIDAEKKHLYVHGYKAGSVDAIRGTSIVMVFNIPEPSSSVTTVTLTDDDILWEFEFYVKEAAQDLYVAGGKLYYPYGGPNLHGLAVIDAFNGEIIQDIELTNISTNFITNPEPEGVYISNGNLYLNYHHAGSNNNEVCIVEFPLQQVKESVPVATNKVNGLLSFKDKEKLDKLTASIKILTQEEYDALETKSEDTIYFIKG